MDPDFRSNFSLDSFSRPVSANVSLSPLEWTVYAGVTNGGTPDNGATNAKERVSLIADSTMAHEAGHFLGALTAEGKYDSEYGHPEKSQEMLMHAQHSERKFHTQP